ncbi:hypothetical protein BC829DRAFT_176713 [Chytridium lagenaria]|nr:hypothetical protein BC829DRAFT_176713 [Chytridium lagenaria]
MEIQFHMERYRHELMSQGSTTAPTFPRSDPSMFGSSSMADLTRPSDDLMSSDHLNMGLSSQSISNLFPVVSSVGFGLQPSSNMGTYHHASDTSSGGTLNANGGSTVFSPAQGLPQIPTSGHPGDASNWIQDLLHSVDGSPNIDPAFDQDEYLSMDFGFLDKLVPPAPAPTPSTSASPPPSETISSTKSKIYRSPVSRYISTPDLKPLPAATHLIATGDGDALPPIHLSKSSVCHPCQCLECDVGIGVVILYGSEQELQDPVSIEISCANCTTKRDSNLVERSTPFKPATESASKKRRARTAGRERVVYCEACNRRVGFGGVRAGDKDLKFEDKERDWIETRASVEPICVACVRNFGKSFLRFFPLILR